MAESIEFPFEESPGEIPSQPAQSIGPPEGWQPTPGSLEAQVYGKHHTLWALGKTFEEMIPFGKVVSESGRAELGAMSTGEQALWAGTQAAFVAAPYIGKFAARWAGTGLRSAFRAMNPTREPLQLELMDAIRSQIKVPQFPSPSEVLRSEYKLEGQEILAWETDDLSYYMRRSGGTPSEAFKNIFDFKEFNETGKAKFKESVRKRLKQAGRPQAVQELEWAKNEWENLTSRVMGLPRGSMSEENHKRIFKYVTKDLFGDDIAKTLDIEDAPVHIYGNVLKAMQDPPYQARLAKLAGAGAGTVLPTMIQPTRVIFGSGDKLFGTNTIYQVGKEAFETFRTSAFESVGKLNMIFHSKGLGKMKVRPSGEIGFKLGKEFKDAYYKAGPAILELERLIQSRAPKVELDLLYGSFDDATRKFVDGYFQWTDDRYLGYLRGKLLQIRDESKFTSPGRSRYDDLLDNDADGVFKQLGEVFTPSADVSPYSKDLALEMQMDRVRRLVDQLVNEKHIKEDFELLSKRLAWYNVENSPGGLIGYLDNFITATGQKHGVKNNLIQKTLATPRTSRYFVPGEATGLNIAQAAQDVSKDLASMVEARARKQGLELFFYPEMKKLFDKFKEIPTAYKEYTGHWIFRMLGKPTPVDARVGEWLTKTYGGIERLLGMKTAGIWNAERVRNLSYNINNLIYMGGLGFKPFSAARNFFQPFVTVPTDLGGAKEYRWFFKGISAASNPEVRKYIAQDLKMIAEYAPELHLQARATSAGIKLPGTQMYLPDLQQFRDIGMFMFQLSDRWSRYVSGGAALSKWNHFAEKMIHNGVAEKDFLKKMNIAGRYEWVRKDIEHLLQVGGEANIKKARDIFVKDVISDTQYLYGQTESPIIMSKYGAPGRLAVTFQSWWMNYATLLEKWARTGDSGATKANRLFGFMFSSAIAEQLMEPLWGRGIASATVGFGPFPGEVSEFLIPPTYAPFYRLLAGMISIGKMDLDAAERHGRGFLRSAGMFIPGGLQASATIKGGIKEGWEGIGKSLIRYQKATNYEPLWGLFD